MNDLRSNLLYNVVSSQDFPSSELLGNEGSCIWYRAITQMPVPWVESVDVPTVIMNIAWLIQRNMVLLYFVERHGVLGYPGV
jgi:hypothetical protein